MNHHANQRPRRPSIAELQNRIRRLRAQRKVQIQQIRQILQEDEVMFNQLRWLDQQNKDMRLQVFDMKNALDEILTAKVEESDQRH